MLLFRIDKNARKEMKIINKTMSRNSEKLKAINGKMYANKYSDVSLLAFFAASISQCFFE
jgi:hypothetical protein